jgi:hypothetical protein
MGGKHFQTEPATSVARYREIPVIIMSTIRIAMWSGPRNISTAMMRAWGNRLDTAVIDEPFYAFYLKASRKNHPGADEIIAAGETDWRKVVAHLTGPIPNGKRVFFQKQMAHHLLPEVDRQWLSNVTNCFLIRDPAEVIASYLQKREEPALEDLGFVQQSEIFDLVRESREPAIVDAKGVREHPERTLRLLCNAIEIEFDPAMLSWLPGLRETDGIWAKHWYTEVARSTSFQPYHPKHAEIPAHLRETYERCRDSYARLYQRRLR